MTINISDVVVWSLGYVFDVGMGRRRAVQDNTQMRHMGVGGDRRVVDGVQKAVNFGEDRFGTNEDNLSLIAIKLERTGGELGFKSRQEDCEGSVREV